MAFVFECALLSVAVVAGARADQLAVTNTKRFERELSPLLHSIFFETEVNESRALFHSSVPVALFFVFVSESH
jgi:hypothetical protein